MKSIKINIVVILITMITLCSCAEKLYSTSTENDVIHVKQAYAQTEIPGQEEGKKQNYLKLKLEFTTKDVVRIDSVFYNNKMHIVGGPGVNLRINLKGGSAPNKMPKVKEDQAIIFYSYSGNSGTKLIESVEVKPALYLP